MRFFTMFFLLLIGATSISLGQTLRPGKGVGELTLGMTIDDVTWILGFEGKRISYDDYLTASVQSNPKSLPETKIDFDYCLDYVFIMTLPVEKIFMKDDKVVMIQLSSFPDYNKILCEDIETDNGVRFFEDASVLDQHFKKGTAGPSALHSNLSNIFYYNEGIAFGLEKDKIRAMYIFDPQ
ncbi:hypothetical protein [Persicobacter psychrovividus]|uniref:Uncharacterized protein n=1 Tax=Persicobacter psychrovividus TaxID=387638 RepID=A0ABM7VCP5_9BACT|nr:hypothetical protein PEPS_09790 [Persicobacter psychrovividus]